MKNGRIIARRINIRAMIRGADTGSDKIIIPNNEEVIIFPELVRMLTKLTVSFEYNITEKIKENPTIRAKPPAKRKVLKFILMQKPESTKKQRLPNIAFIRL